MEVLLILIIIRHTHPSFLVNLSVNDLSKTSMKLPSGFVTQCGDHVPEQVTLQLPNVYQYYARFNKDGKKFENIGLFYGDFKTDKGFTSLLYYREEGIFTIFILDDTGMKIDYPAKKKLLLAPVFLEDNIDGIGKKFIVKAVQRNRGFPEIELPATFVDRFRHMLKRNNFLSLNNGYKYKFTFSATTKKLVNLGAILKNRYCKAGDTILFELTHKTEFAVSIFSGKKIEKTFLPLSSNTENVIASVDQNVNLPIFSDVLIPSNLDMNSHGVYIPHFIAPEKHEWKHVRKVILKMNGRKWKVGVVCSGSKPRFSSGWDKFVKENRLALNDKLSFLLIEDDDIISFAVDVI